MNRQHLADDAGIFDGNYDDDDDDDDDDDVFGNDDMDEITSLISFDNF